MMPKQNDDTTATTTDDIAEELHPITVTHGYDHESGAYVS